MRSLTTPRPHSTNPQISSDPVRQPSPQATLGWSEEFLKPGSSLCSLKSNPIEMALNSAEVDLDCLTLLFAPPKC